MPRVALLAVLLLLAAGAIAADPGGSSPQRRTELMELVRQDCGSCHGLTMKGGLGPALVPAALADKDPEQMRFVILNGRHGTPMPPWRDFLSDGEARWVVDQLRKGLPDAR